MTNSFANKGRRKPYTDQSQSGDWARTVNAAKLLSDLFSDISEARVSFKKTDHGVKLTEWLIDNEASELQELVDMLRKILSRSRTCEAAKALGELESGAPPLRLLISPNPCLIPPTSSRWATKPFSGSRSTKRWSSADDG